MYNAAILFTPQARHRGCLPQDPPRPVRRIRPAAADLGALAEEGRAEGLQRGRLLRPEHRRVTTRSLRSNGFRFGAVICFEDTRAGPVSAASCSAMSTSWSTSPTTRGSRPRRSWRRIWPMPSSAPWKTAARWCAPRTTASPAWSASTASFAPGACRSGKAA